MVTPKPMPSSANCSPGRAMRPPPSGHWSSSTTKPPNRRWLTFLADKVDLPDWVDLDAVATGQECFARWGSHVFTALYAAALPSAYACWRGVQVLGLTARLETDAKRRLNETAQFHLDVMDPGGLEPGAQGYSDVRHVRLDARGGEVADRERPPRHLGCHLGDADQPGRPARDASDLHRDRLRGLRSDRCRVYREGRRRVPAHLVADRLSTSGCVRTCCRSPVRRLRC